MATSHPSHYRYIKKLKVKGVEKRYRPNRHYVFIIKVTWSDNSEYILYRSYGDFFDFHSKLLDLFPKEGGSMRELDRVIPYLPGRKLFQRTEVYKVANRRRYGLNEYCNSLIGMSKHISQCDHVSDFFMALPNDINPPKDARLKPENPLELLSALLPFSIKTSCLNNKCQGLSGSELNVTGPLVLDQYKVTADYIAEDKTGVTLYEDSIVDVVEKNENGWWFIEFGEIQGWAPASYLEPITSSIPDENEPNFDGEKYMTTEAYTAMYDDEVSFGVCAIVEVLHKLLDGWWVVSYMGKVGYAPSTYLQPYEHPLLNYVAEIDLPSKAERERLVKKASQERVITIVRKPPPRRRSIKKLSIQSSRDLQIYEKMNTLSRQRKASIPQTTDFIYQDSDSTDVLQETRNSSMSWLPNMSSVKAEESDDESDDGYEKYDYKEDNDYESIPDDSLDDIQTILVNAASGAIGETLHKARIGYDNHDIKTNESRKHEDTQAEESDEEGYENEDVMQDLSVRGKQQHLGELSSILAARKNQSTSAHQQIKKDTKIKSNVMTNKSILPKSSPSNIQTPFESIVKASPVFTPSAVSRPPLTPQKPLLTKNAKPVIKSKPVQKMSPVQSKVIQRNIKGSHIIPSPAVLAPKGVTSLAHNTSSSRAAILNNNNNKPEVPPMKPKYLLDSLKQLSKPKHSVSLNVSSDTKLTHALSNELDTHSHLHTSGSIYETPLVKPSAMRGKNSPFR